MQQTDSVVRRQRKTCAAAAEIYWRDGKETLALGLRGTDDHIESILASSARLAGVVVALGGRMSMREILSVDTGRFVEILMVLPEEFIDGLPRWTWVAAAALSPVVVEDALMGGAGRCSWRDAAATVRADGLSGVELRVLSAGQYEMALSGDAELSW